ncbi:hypothetical protein B0J11DRAFT_540935 [Dendryphion nanum]|uniref:Uncharacterized protein n=1 Tax=Dendryphion nanum TaxID=256645 RepID=A0A9P9D8I5_9PLEO|nr:hypothetical protein B0J11DRAFT_540935 [Dendryphion nanum]
MSYKLEELLALRDSVSESAVSIDKFADEDVIKEHVLRPSASANLVGSLPEVPRRPIPTPAVAVATANLKKPSPSPSIKRGKAERLLKEHGSPPGMRVTAGGRVVPSDLQTLAGVRVGHNNNNDNMKLSPVRSMDPNIMVSQHHPLTREVSNLEAVELVGTKILLRIDGQEFFLPTSANFAMESNVTSPVDINNPPSASARVAPQVLNANNPIMLQHASSQGLPCDVSLPALRAEHASKKEELRRVEQTEVIRSESESAAWRRAIIQQKMSLTLQIDKLRKKIMAAEEAQIDPSFPAANGHSGVPLASPLGQYPAPMIHQQIYPVLTAPFNPTNQQQYSPNMTLPPYATQGFPVDAPQFARDPQFFIPGEAPASFSSTHVPMPGIQTRKAAQSPGSASRRSHAIEIKPPQESIAKKHNAQGSTLDPKSPTYEPFMTIHGIDDIQNTTGVSGAMTTSQSNLRLNETLHPRFHRHEERALSQKPSLSSIDTTDFFPLNTHEHSSTRVAPGKVSGSSSCDNVGAPITPEKNWSVGPWNAQSVKCSPGSSRSIRNDPAKKLQSWPETFGPNGSLSGNVRKPMVESAPPSTALRTNSSLTAETEQTWAPSTGKPNGRNDAHTYQQGYQSGVQLLGIPSNLDYMRGLVDGLSVHIKEAGDINSSNWGAKTSGNSSGRSSLRGHLSGPTFQDSATSLMENKRSEPVTAPAVFLQRVQSNPSGQGSLVHSLMSPLGVSFVKNDPSRSFTSANRGFSRQSSGHHLANRTNGTATSPQRFFIGTQDYASGGLGRRVSPPKPLVLQRYSGLDGAADDLASLVDDAPLDEQDQDQDVSCFKASVAKGKQKATSSPVKSNSSPARGSGSPKKSSEISPAKAKLEQVTNKLRRTKKDNPRTLPTDDKDKDKRALKWRARFQTIRDNEEEYIKEYNESKGRKPFGTSRH